MSLVFKRPERTKIHRGKIAPKCTVRKFSWTSYVAIALNFCFKMVFPNVPDTINMTVNKQSIFYVVRALLGVTQSRPKHVRPQCNLSYIVPQTTSLVSLHKYFEATERVLVVKRQKEQEQRWWWWVRCSYSWSLVSLGLPCLAPLPRRKVEKRYVKVDSRC